MRWHGMWRIAAAVFLLSSPASVWSDDATATERDWIQRAEALVTAARSHADAARFQGDVQAHRERLRDIVRRAGPTPAPERRQLHGSMILLNALLKSAADCHRAGRIVCPADLMRQLDVQVRTAWTQLKALER